MSQGQIMPQNVAREQKHEISEFKAFYDGLDDGI